MNTLVLNTSSKKRQTPQLHSFPIDGPDNTLPVNVLIDPNDIIPRPLTRERLLFCYQVLLNTIDSCLAKRYTDFDGHTTTNCCHGMALLSWHLIPLVLELDLQTLRQEYEQKLYRLEQHIENGKEPQLKTGFAPKELVNLSGLYTLCFLKESDPLKGGRTNTKKLRTLAPLSINVCNQISHSLQKLFANWVASSYVAYLEQLDEELHVSGIPATLWGKYVGEDFIRLNRYGAKYVATLFSKQLCLAYFSQVKGKIALVNDIQNSASNLLIDRYVCLFEGDGKGGFTPITPDELNSLRLFSQDEPIIISGGCMHTPSQTISQDTLSLKMQPWLDKLPELILACDVFYPQFPRVIDDPEFDPTPITPHEPALQQLFSLYEKIRGVSSADPSLYCLTHHYTSSLQQLFSLDNSPNTLPVSFIPKVKQPSAIF